MVRKWSLRKFRSLMKGRRGKSGSSTVFWMTYHFPSSCFKHRLGKKETITDKSPVWTRNLIPGRNLPIPVWSVSPPQLPHPVRYLSFILFYRNIYCSFLPDLFTWLTAVGVQLHTICQCVYICNTWLKCASHFTAGLWGAGNRAAGCTGKPVQEPDPGLSRFQLSSSLPPSSFALSPLCPNFP